ncbi:SNF2 family N-terminal domain-containing protein [Sordaria brevicollis]|uniref:SNF2 family N-terminal domain-containing protein n=1 Tax=Sordaria brevicollis TaxID=83679 RepID=A0AAE0P8X4_SORBR|nr:SNF2 family N-terminal domain-containing protein [Sordaria brevicollis]
MTTPRRATASSPTHSSSWQTRSRPFTSNTNSQSTAELSDLLNRLETDLAIQLELRAQLKEDPTTDDTERDLAEIDQKICAIVKEMDRTRNLLGLPMEGEFWGSSDDSQPSAGTPTPQQQVRQQGNQIRQQQAQREQPSQQQPHRQPHQRSQPQQQPRQQQRRTHPHGEQWSQQGSHEQGQQPFQPPPPPQQREDQIDDSDDFIDLDVFVPRDRKRSIGTSLGDDALGDSGRSSKRAASGSGISEPMALQDAFDLSRPAGHDSDSVDYDDGFDWNGVFGLDDGPFIDLTGDDDNPQLSFGQGSAQVFGQTSSTNAPSRGNEVSYHNVRAPVPRSTSLTVPQFSAPVSQAPGPARQLHSTQEVLPDMSNPWANASYNPTGASATNTSSLSRLARPQLPSFSSNAPPSNNMSLVYPSLAGGLLNFDNSLPGIPANGGYYAPNIPGSAGTHISSLNDVISRTATYDYTSMTDAWGNPLDERLTSLGLDDFVKEEDINKLLSNIRPDEDIPPEERGETPPDLKYPLYPHQQLALKWMNSMELGYNKGGILADDMGLGKTISMLALMASHRAPDGQVGTNLIVGPVALIKQWELEIRNKMKDDRRMNVYLYHGGAKKKPWEELKEYDVVLTTYGTLAAQLKKYDSYVEKSFANPDGLDDATEKKFRRDCPMLHHRTKFFRVILDEAQCVKNAKTIQAKAVRQLKATYRWCLTGTPMMNSVSELSSLLRFLAIKPFCDERKFREAFGSLDQRNSAKQIEKSNAMKQLQALLKAIMLRRMKTTVIDGKPILNLPPKVEHIVHVQFSPDEHDFYKKLDARTQITYGRYVRNNTVGKNYSNILVLLLRLRQACCHPHLTDFEAKPDNHLAEATMIELAKSLDPAVVERIKNIQSFECPICYDAVPDPTIILPCGHDICTDCFSSLADQSAMNGIRNGQDGGAVAKCPVCRGTADQKKVTNYTSFQMVHMPEALKKADIDDSDDDADSGTESDTSDGSLGSLSGERKHKVKGKKGRSSEVKPEVKEDWKPDVFLQLRKEADASRNQDARDRLLKYTFDHWQDSAKVTRVVELVDEFQQSNEKTIIFSQWTSFLDLIECSLKFKLKLKYHRYTGSMPRTQRDNAIQAFVEDPDVKVLLVSLKAGNAGLNLTVASRVIICDPFWNPFIEDQAVDRAYRIGQKKEVHIYKILVQETIEDRIIELQTSKRNIVEAALDETQSKELARLSLEDLNYLFTGRRRGARA